MLQSEGIYVVARMEVNDVVRQLWLLRKSYYELWNEQDDPSIPFGDVQQLTSELVLVLSPPLISSIEMGTDIARSSERKMLKLNTTIQLNSRSCFSSEITHYATNSK